MLSVDCLLFVCLLYIGCWLLIVVCWLSIVDCLLLPLVVDRWFLIACVVDFGLLVC